jgi:hypothetical protein
MFSNNPYLVSQPLMVLELFGSSLCVEFRKSLTGYLLTPRSRVRLEKLTGFQLDKKFPSFYGTRRFITAVTRACLLSLSWASSIQSIPPNATSWRSILILSSHLRPGLPSGLFLQDSETPLLGYYRYWLLPSDWQCHNTEIVSNVCCSAAALAEHRAGGQLHKIAR